MSKGRDKRLIQLRNEALCRRYYYWTEVQRLRFDDAVKILSQQEFFIAEETILKIIRTYADSGSGATLETPTTKQPRLTRDQLALFKDKQ